MKLKRILSKFENRWEGNNKESIKLYTIDEMEKLMELNFDVIKRGAENKVARRADEHNLGTYYQGITETGVLMYKTTSATTPGVDYWYQEIKLLEFEDALDMANDMDLSDEDVVNLMVFGDIKVMCECIGEGSRVLTSDGVKKIEDIEVGDEVVTHKGNFKKVKFKNEREVRKDEDVYKLDIKGYPEPLMLTEDHEVLVKRGNEECLCGCGYEFDITKMYETKSRDMVWNRKWKRGHYRRDKKLEDNSGGVYKWVKVRNLRKKDVLLIPKIDEYKETMGNSGIDNDYARLLGYYLAEGSLMGGNERDSGIKLTLNQNEVDSLGKDIKDICNRLDLNVTENFVKQDDGRKWVDYNIFGKRIARECKRFCGEYSRKKKINKEIFGWSKDNKLNFLAGYVLGDGHVYISSGQVVVDTSSIDLVHQIHYLLASVGIDGYIMLNGHGEVDRKKFTNNKHDMNRIKISCNQAYKLKKVMMPYMREDDKKVKMKNNSNWGNNQDENYVYRTLMGIEKVNYNKKVYDITVEDDESLVVNSISAHNCPAFLYWGYKYISWNMDFGIERENREPDIRNPDRDGTVCKHVYNVLSVLPNHIFRIASDLREMDLL